MKRCAIYIDVEGFSALWERNQDEALTALGILANGIYRIGSGLGTGQRLFAHQVGDGFVIILDLVEGSVQQSVVISISLLQFLLQHGFVGRCGISVGDFSDVRGCLPEEVKHARDESGAVPMGSGLMTLFTVMGGALINAVKVQENRTSGPLLFLDANLQQDVGIHCIKILLRESRYVVVDWVSSQPPELDDMFKLLGSGRPGPKVLSLLLRSYIKRNRELRCQWIRNALRMTRGHRIPKLK